MLKMLNVARHHIDSYNYFIHHELKNIIANEMPLKIAKSPEKKITIYFFNPRFASPTTETYSKIPLYPDEARLYNLTYSSSIYVDIMEIVQNGNKIEQQIYKNELLTKLPIPLKCSVCHLNQLNKEELISHNENENDPGGYFIIKGKERVLVSQIRLAYNSPIITKNDDTTCIEVRFCNPVNFHTTLIKLEIDANYKIFLISSFFKDKIPIAFLFIIFDIDDPENFISTKTLEGKHALNQIKFTAQQKSKQEVLETVSTMLANFAGDPITAAKQIFFNELFPHLNINLEPKFKLLNLSILINILTDTVATNTIPEQYERDSLCNKRLESAGILCSELFRQMFKRYCSSMIKELEKKTINLSCRSFVQKNQIIMRKFLYCFTNSSWGAQQNSYTRVGVSQVLAPVNYLSFLSHLQRINIPIAKDTKNVQIRQLHPSHLLFICGAESPEGNTIGIVLNLAQKCSVSNRTPFIPLSDYIKKCPYVDYQIKNIQEIHHILLNGIIIAQTTKSEEFLSWFKNARLLGIIPSSVSIYQNAKIFHIFCDEGRFIYKFDEKRFIDPLEKYNYDPVTLLKNPHEMFSICSAIIPASNHSPAPRICYGSGMVKQAIGTFVYNFASKINSTLYYLHYPQKQLVYTQTAKEIDLDEMPFGVNVIVAIASFTGFNQEDACIVHKGAIDRGLFISSIINCNCEEESPEVKIGIPPEKSRKSKYNYSHLSPSGLPKVGQILKSNDVVIGKWSSSDDQINDLSVVVKKQTVVVTQVFDLKNELNYRLVKVIVSELTIPEIGDKISSTISQKGVIGMILNSEDMPFTKDGMIPDVIINPHAIPSRMTISQLIECIMGKEAALSGKRKDATPFKVPKDFGDQLLNYGFSSSGEEEMYNGMYGTKFNSKVFIGPTYYMRLKHLVSHKIHARDDGDVTSLTRSAPEGRRRDGGLKVGEMEKDALVAHGATQMLLERLFYFADHFQVLLCSTCGEISASEICKLCNNQCYNVDLPYIFKLIKQELAGLNLKIGIKPS